MASAVARRAALVLGPALGLLVVAGLSATYHAAAVAAEPGDPTVSFVREGGRGSCTSVPTVASLTVPLGTEVVVANRTRRGARLFVGEEFVLRVDEGEGVALVFALGQYDVRLVPNCLKDSADAPPVVVTVTAPASPSPTSGTAQVAGAADSADPSPPPAAAESGPGGPSHPAGEAVAVASTRTEPPTGRASASTAVPTPTAAPAWTAAPTAAPTPVTVPDETGIISARPVALDAASHPKGLRLLAAIATICVLGVTVAIIRAIVRLSP